MWTVQNASNEVLSFHTIEADADASKERLGPAGLTVSDETMAYIMANLKQD